LNSCETDLGLDALDDAVNGVHNGGTRANANNHAILENKIQGNTLCELTGANERG